MFRMMNRPPGKNSTRIDPIPNIEVDRYLKQSTSLNRWFRNYGTFPLSVDFQKIREDYFLCAQRAKMPHVAMHRVQFEMGVNHGAEFKLK